jgi:hypothetical protein
MQCPFNTLVDDIGENIVTPIQTACMLCTVLTADLFFFQLGQGGLRIIPTELRKYDDRAATNKTTLPRHVASYLCKSHLSAFLYSVILGSG